MAGVLEGLGGVVDGADEDGFARLGGLLADVYGDEEYGGINGWEKDERRTA